MSNSIGVRIKELREYLGMSGSAFAESVGLSRGALSNIERNVNGVSDRTVRLICSIYKVEYFWLTEGSGNMLVNSTDALIEELAAENQLSPDTVEVFKKLFRLPEDEFNLVMQLIYLLPEKDK